MKYRVLFIALVLAVAAWGFVGPALDVSCEKVWICAGCGSCTGRTTVLGVFRRSEYYRASPLQEWLSAHNLPHTHNWCPLHETIRDGTGHLWESGSWGAPPICGLDQTLLDPPLSDRDVSEVRRLVAVLENGSKDEQKEAIRRFREAKPFRDRETNLDQGTQKGRESFRLPAQQAQPPRKPRGAAQPDREPTTGGY